MSSFREVEIVVTTFLFEYVVVAFGDDHIAVCVAFNVVIIAVLVVIVVVAVDDPGVPAVAHSGAYYLSNNF